MKKTANIKSLLVTVAASTFLFSCAKELPELPVYATPAIVNASASASASATDTPALLPLTAAPSETNAALRFVANDLVSALSFVSGISPELVSIKSANTNTIFDNMVTTALISRGYRVDQRYDGISNQQLATSFLQRSRTTDTYDITGIISINSVLLKRTYTVNGNSITPNASYSIRGVNPQLVRASDLIRVL